jgi:hypothetical protein
VVRRGARHVTDWRTLLLRNVFRSLWSTKEVKAIEKT